MERPEAQVSLQKAWSDKARFEPFFAALAIDDRGLILGPSLLLAAMTRDAIGMPVLDLDGQDERLFALLSIGFRKPVSIDALKFIKRASMQWAKGEKALAHIELAFARLPKFETREDARLLYYADGLIKVGVPPRALMAYLGFDTRALDLLKYNPAQPRVPAGHGRASGEWTSGQFAEGPSISSTAPQGEVLSDVSPEPVKPGQHYAQDRRRYGVPPQLPTVGNSVGGGGGGSTSPDPPQITGGRLGNAATRQLNADIAKQLEDEGYVITGGGGKAGEEYIRGAGPGTKGSTYVDITATDGNVTIRVQTIDTYSNGDPVAREAAAAQRIRREYPDDELRLIPKRGRDR